VDIVTDQRRSLEFGVNLYADHGDRVVQDHGVESMEGIRGKTVQTDGNGGDDGSHVQEAFGRRLKSRGLIYPGNNPEWIMPTGSGGVAQKNRKDIEARIGEAMDSSSETVMLLLLGLICMAVLTMLPIKEGEDPSGVRASIGARNSHRRGGVRQVTKQVAWMTADAQQGESRRTVATVLNRSSREPGEGWPDREAENLLGGGDD